MSSFDDAMGMLSMEKNEDKSYTQRSRLDFVRSHLIQKITVARTGKRITLKNIVDITVNGEVITIPNILKYLTDNTLGGLYFDIDNKGSIDAYNNIEELPVLCIRKVKDSMYASVVHEKALVDSGIITYVESEYRAMLLYDARELEVNYQPTEAVSELLKVINDSPNIDLHATKELNELLKAINNSCEQVECSDDTAI